MHATDLPFFDSRLNILGWTLLAGLAAFNQERGTDFTRQGLIVMIPQRRRSQGPPEVGPGEGR